MGRPSLLNPSVQENIIRALRSGSHLKHAVESFGVSYATAARWMADGQAHAEGTATTAQRTNLGSSADSVASPACAGMDETNTDGSIGHVCQSPLHSSSSTDACAASEARYTNGRFLAAR